LDKELVADWKPATVKGVRYETRNVGGNVISRAVVTDVPSAALPKYEDTLYGRYTSALPKKLVEAASLAMGGNLKAAQAIRDEINAWVDADEPRLMKHMAYKGQDRVAAEFAQVAKDAITRDWEKDLKWQNLMNPATNPRIAQYEAEVIGIPEGLLRNTFLAARDGDPEARAKIEAFRRSAPGGALVQRSAAGARPAAAAADTPLMDRKDDPAFGAKVFQNADVTIPSFFSGDANKNRTTDQRMRNAWSYTELVEAHPQVKGILAQVMSGAQSADPAAQSALFEHTMRALSETAQAVGDLAPLAMIAAEEIVKTNVGAQGAGFRAMAPQLQQNAVGVAQQVAAAQQNGFVVPDAAVRRLARLRSGAADLSPADQKVRDALGSFRSAYQALNADITLAQSPEVAAALGTTPASGKTPERVGGLDMLVGAIQDIAGGVAMATAGTDNLTPEALHVEMLSRAPAVADVLLRFGGTVEVNGRPQQMTRDQALMASRLLLAYIAKNPAVNITEAFTKMGQEMGVISVGSAPQPLGAPAPTSTGATKPSVYAEAIKNALLTSTQGASGYTSGEKEYQKPYLTVQPELAKVWQVLTLGSGTESSGFRKVLENVDVREWAAAREARNANKVWELWKTAYAAMKQDVASLGLQSLLTDAVLQPVAKREFEKIMGRVGFIRPTGALVGTPREYDQFANGTVRDTYGPKGYERWLASGTDLGDRDLAWWPDRTLDTMALGMMKGASEVMSLGMVNPVTQGRFQRSGSGPAVTIDASDLLTERLLFSITGKDPDAEGHAAAIHRHFQALATPSAPAPARPGPVTSTSYLELAQVGGSNTVDPEQAVAAGQAVIKRITERVLTEATRASLYDKAVGQYYLSQGVPPSVLNKARQDAIGAFYHRAISESQVVHEFQYPLDVAVDKIKKAKAAAKAGGGIVAASDIEE